MNARNKDRRGVSRLTRFLLLAAVPFVFLIAEAQAQTGTSGWLTFWPGLAIAVTVLGFNVFGDGLRDALDPKFSRAGR